MNTYNWDAKDYEINSQSQQKWGRELIEKLYLKGTEVVLDIGCGDGKVTAEIAQQVKKGSVIGIDSSSSMIKLAKEKYSQSEYPNLSFEEMDARSLSYKECFDVVFSNAALHWVKNHKPVVEGIYKSLKPGGRIFIQMGGKGNAKDILSVFEKIQSDPEWQPYFYNFEFPYGFFGCNEYKKLLIDSGFNVKNIKLIPKDMEHDGKVGLQGWIRTTWLPYLESVPEDQRETFIELISAKYIKQFPLDTDGRVHIAMVRIQVEAEKIVI